MNPRAKYGGLIVLVVLSVLAAVWFAPASPKRVPDVELPTIDGRTVQLAELRGRPLIVTFWATTCAACLREIPHLIDLYHALAPKGLEIIGIAMYYDPPNQVIEMSRRRKIPYTIALDMDADAAKAFGYVRLTPTNFVIAPNGRVVRKKVGAFTDDELASLRQQIEHMLATTADTDA